MAKQKPKPAFLNPKRDTSNTSKAKATTAGKSGAKPMKQCKCGGHG